MELRGSEKSDPFSGRCFELNMALVAIILRVEASGPLNRKKAATP